MTAESITNERLIQKFEDVSSSFIDPATKHMRPHSSITCFSPELSVFLQQRDIKFLSTLTDFYDSADDWRYETKNKGDQHIHGICFNLLGATAPDWMQSMFPQEAIGGGFTSRTIFVYEEKKGKTIPKEVFTPWHEERERALVNDLSIISNLVGEYKFDDETDKLYTEWYKDYDANMQRGIYPVDDPRFSGYMERRATHLRKLCMVLSASRSNSLIIEAVDFSRSMNILDTVEKRMHKAFGGLGRSAYSEAVELVLDYMLVHKRARRSQIMRQYYRDIDSQTMRVVEEVLSQMKMVKVTLDVSGGDNIYELTI